jgi:P27 family predicted phage terminase small subunit
VEAPKPPTKLTKPAKDVWKALAPSLAACGILTAADLPAFNRYCRLYALWSALMAKVEEEPNRGAILTLAKVDDMVKSLECSFGLTPSDRPGLRVETPEPTGKARFFGTETR